MKRSLFAALVAIGLFLGSAAAEPSDSIRYLIQEPVSLLDVGLFNLEERIFDSLGGHWSVSVDYSLRDNAILILLWRNFDNVESPEDPRAKEWVQGALKTVREVCGYREDGTIINPQTGGVIGNFFTHRGYSSPRTPKTLVDDVNGIVEIRSTVHCRDGRLESVTKLTGKEVVWKTIPSKGKK
ncbi:MAG TPA: hypothetical protein PK876_01095 [Elusimicrobiota bacterium]|nr:hypothetical protein [Elusimicrobiota bacterium]